MNHTSRNYSAVSLCAALTASALLAAQYAPAAHAAPAPAPAPVLNWTKPYVTKGTTEYELAGLIGLSPSNVYSVSGTVGPFLTNQFQVAGTVAFDKVSDFNSTTYGVEGNFHIPFSASTPENLYYVGGFVGGDHISGGGVSGNSTAVGAQIGIEHFLTPYVAVTTGVDYRHPTSNSSGQKDTTRLMFGLATFSQPGAPKYGTSTEDIAALLPDKGTREIGLSGLIGIQPSNIYNADLTYGPFLNKQVQIAGNVGINKAGDFTDTTYGLEGNFHFPSNSPAVPFVGVFVGGDHVTGGGDSADATAVGGQAGVKYFLNQNVAAEAAVNYRHPTKSDAGLKDITQINIGLGIYLR